MPENNNKNLNNTQESEEIRKFQEDLRLEQQLESSRILVDTLERELMRKKQILDQIQGGSES
jgi:hypothetical protein